MRTLGTDEDLARDLLNYSHNNNNYKIILKNVQQTKNLQVPI